MGGKWISRCVCSWCLENECANLLLIMHSQCRNSYLFRSKRIGFSCLLCRQAILVADSACKLASIFVQSYYYIMVRYVSVFTKVWLLTCCSYPWPWLLEPARCVMEPGVLILAALQAAGTASPAFDAPLEPAACLLCRWRGRRMAVVFLACETSSLPPILVHWSCGNSIGLLLMLWLCGN
jgi:hypothetical protein